MPINSSQIEQLVCNYINNPPNSYPTKDKLLSDIKDALSKGDDANAILLTTQLKDLQQNIVWVTNHDDTDTPVTLRDARKVNASEPCAYMAYACQGFQGIRACRKLLELNDKLTPNAKAVLNTLALQFWQTIDTTKSREELALLNKSLLRILQAQLNISRKDSIKRLLKAKDFASLEKPSHAVITLNQLTVEGKTHQFFEADLPLTQLTKEQIKEYNERESKLWYTSLSPWKKQLVDHYWDNYLKYGNRVIPNPLRDCMVGCRNAYEKIRGHVDNENSVEIISDNLHSGTLAHLNKDIKQSVAKRFLRFFKNEEPPRNAENFRLSELNARQMEMHAGKNPIHLITLNSEFNVNGDRQIVQQSRAAIEKNSHSRYTNLAMNNLRKVTPNDYDGAKREIASAYVLIKEIENLQNTPENQKVSTYLNPEGQNPPRMHFQEILNSIKAPQYDKKLHKLLKAAATAQFLINRNRRIHDPNNRNLSIITNLSIINFEIRKHFPEINHPKMVYACRSGKDRTGVVEFNNTKENMFYALTDKFVLLNPTQEEKTVRHELIKQLAHSGHQRFMPGFVNGGGSTGCEGIKSDSVSSFPENYSKNIVNLLMQPTAKLNKKILTKSSLNFLGQNNMFHDELIPYATRAVEFHLENEKSPERIAVLTNLSQSLIHVKSSEDLLKAFTDAKQAYKEIKSSRMSWLISGNGNSQDFFNSMEKNLQKVAKQKIATSHTPNIALSDSSTSAPPPYANHHH